MVSILEITFFFSPKILKNFLIFSHFAMNWYLFVTCVYANVVIYENYGLTDITYIELGIGKYPNNPYPTNNFSISVPSGFFVELYEEPDFRGFSGFITGPSNVHLSQVKSIKVIETKTSVIYNIILFIASYFLLIGFAM
jgi:hypothetical protein